MVAWHVGPIAPWWSCRSSGLSTPASSTVTQVPIGFGAKIRSGIRTNRLSRYPPSGSAAGTNVELIDGSPISSLQN